MVVYLVFFSVLICIGKTHRLVARSRLANQTDVNSELPTCGIPYDELCCSVLQSTDPEILKYCVPDNILLHNRITVSVSMVMIAFILQFAFKIDGKHSRLVVRTLWTLYAVAFVFITYRVHYDSCFHSHTFEFLIFPGAILYCIVLSLVPQGRDCHLPLNTNDNNSNHAPIEVDDGSTEPADNTPILRVEIL
ncbi:unnamed protein product [Adineta ricciae]|uniref:Uncharacterized protein n=1 Tax=Adineta ricciae TaxID=249248 RepID=A0A816DHZ2_ADIRI|nr:unnamed protein product [Adineta ricciae]CAF1634330.1 unnamed protein product [Adineta ricciae]